MELECYGARYRVRVEMVDNKGIRGPFRAIAIQYSGTLGYTPYDSGPVVVIGAFDQPKNIKLSESKEL